jgi:hypothetical protein
VLFKVFRLPVNAGGGVIEGSDGVVGTTVVGLEVGGVEDVRTLVGAVVLVGAIVLVGEDVGLTVELAVGVVEGVVVVVVGLDVVLVEQPVKIIGISTDMEAVVNNFRKCPGFLSCITFLKRKN